MSRCGNAHASIARMRRMTWIEEERNTRISHELGRTLSRPRVHHGEPPPRPPPLWFWTPPLQHGYSVPELRLDVHKRPVQLVNCLPHLGESLGDRLQSLATRRSSRLVHVYAPALDYDARNRGGVLPRVPGGRNGWGM